MPTDCGCTIDSFGQYIVYCPLHVAAEALLAAAERYLEFYPTNVGMPHMNSNPCLEMRGALEAIIQQAKATEVTP